MNLWNQFWNDESGAILSAEAALLGTVGVVGATVGLSSIATSVNQELKEAAFAFRSLDQSYSYSGHKSAHAWTAGSSYTQPPVEESLRELQEQIDRQEREAEQHELKEQQPKPPADPKKDRRKKKKRDASSVVDAEWQIDAPDTLLVPEEENIPSPPTDGQ